MGAQAVRIVCGPCRRCVAAENCGREHGNVEDRWNLKGSNAGFVVVQVLGSSASLLDRKSLLVRTFVGTGERDGWGILVDGRWVEVLEIKAKGVGCADLG